MTELTDAFLLILTPAREINFYGQAKKIKNIATEYQTQMQSFSVDYYKLISSYLCISTNIELLTSLFALHSKGVKVKRRLGDFEFLKAAIGMDKYV